MAADDRDAARLAHRHVEPRHEPLRRLLELAFDPEVHDTVSSTEAHARHRIHDHAQPIHAAKAVAPGVRLRAVELREEQAIAAGAQLGLDLGGEVLRLRDRPGR
jgi:hypothetical protein